MKEMPVGNNIDSAWSGPERVVLVTSIDRCGKSNIITIGWVMRTNMDPPVLAIGLSKGSYSCANISRTGEFVLGIPGLDMAAAVIYCGTHSGAEMDKFEGAGLTAAKAKIVRPPLIEECLCNLECKVIATQEIHAHRVFFGEVVTHWSSGTAGRSLLIVGDESGYETVHEEAGFRLGAVAAS